MSTPTPEYLEWLCEHSMLVQVRQLTARYSGQGVLWRNPYAIPQPRAASGRASVWFSSYPPAVITRDGESVLATLDDEQLWEALAEIGIRGLHTGPMKKSGGVCGYEFTPSIDGNFDRIGLELDPAYGTREDYLNMSRNAALQGAIIIDDIVPAHTGKGPDFRLAEFAMQPYPGLYHMVEIPPAAWDLLPPVPEGADAVNLNESTVHELEIRGYIVGPLPRTIFYEPGIKETDWSATGIVEGVDGVARRWVYLHYFKAGQPSLNWLDPSFAAPQLVLGDALHAIGELGVAMLRLDANGFLGIERNLSGPAWSEGHPLAVTANQLIAGLIRKVGGHSFQELNLGVDDIATMSQGGADLSYDFVTRPGYQHALMTGDTEFLRLMMNIMHEYKVDPASLVHALQNHDELTLELVHFWQRHHSDLYMFQEKGWTGGDLREEIRRVMYARLTGEAAPYNLPFVTNGVACTTVSIITAALGIRDLDKITEHQVEQIMRVHLLLAMYNAFQPGVFALSGWDLMGALPLPAESVAHLMGDGDTRWINRGAYDLMSVNPEATTSSTGLPRTRTLYGPLDQQLQDPNSFARRLQTLLAVRQRYQIYAARQIQVPAVQNKGLLVMVHELPEALTIQITALNFGPTPLEEVVHLDNIQSGTVTDMFTDEVLGELIGEGDLHLKLDGYEGKSYLVGARLTQQ